MPVSGCSHREGRRSTSGYVRRRLPGQRARARRLVAPSETQAAVLGTTFSEITDRMELARHGARTFWGLLTRTAATIAAHTLLPTCLTEG